MSPVATGTPAHTRSASTNGGIPVKTNGIKANGAKASSRVFEHLDDLVAARPNVDINAPIRKILLEGELLAKQADTHLDFQRPDIALQEYVKASIIAVDIIPHHKDYPSLQAGRDESHRLYIGLTKRINSQHPKFAEVKEIIKENNAKSGVRPRAQGNTFEASSNTNGVLSPISSGNSNSLSPRKNPPPIQPKPDALHGKAIHSPQGYSNSPSVDLAARFARLRAPELNVPQQDPRIRTQPIIVPNSQAPAASPQTNFTTISRPTGPRELPSVPKTLPQPSKLDIAIPGMPRAPDPIYSPERGPDNATTVNLLTSVSRNSSYSGIGRTTSAPRISTVNNFQPAQMISEDAKKSRPSFSVPDSKTITAEELQKYMRLGSQTLKILIVDLRSREEFDNGHIMSQSIICVEPLTLRPGISGDELSDSMVIAPEMEQQFYDQRNQFDLVVYYDQSSNVKTPSNSVENRRAEILQNFKAAVYDYGYEKRLKQHPQLLLGGIDAWVDLLGPSSLASSTTGSTSTATPRNGRTARPIRPMSSISGNVIQRRAYQSRPLSKAEENAWEKTLREEAERNEKGENSDELVYARTTEDFIRRYPELPSVQESMVSSSHPPLNKNQFSEELSMGMPAPPARPAPALPRQRSSGITEKGRTATHAHSASSNNPTTITNPRVTPGLTGLSNPGNLCYMNATIQAISAMPFLRNFLINFQYSTAAPVPKKSGETDRPPQFMVRILGNVIGHLWCGQYDHIRPTTFARYVQSVHSQYNAIAVQRRNRDEAFGAIGRQQAADEFITFLFDILNDELNPNRNAQTGGANVINVPILSDKDEIELKKGNEVQAANYYWTRLIALQSSITFLNMSGLFVNTLTCELCGDATRNFEPTPACIVLPLLSGNRLANAPPAFAGPDQDIEELLANNYGAKANQILERDCPRKGCKSKAAKQGSFLDNLPDVICIHFSRAYATNVGQTKLRTLVRFPLSIDMAPYVIPTAGASPAELGPRRQGSLRYDVFAVIQHRGATVDSGHYWTIARSPDKLGGQQSPGNWHKFNDSIVTKAKFLEDTQTNETSTIFLHRFKDLVRT